MSIIMTPTLPSGCGPGQFPARNDGGRTDLDIPIPTQPDIAGHIGYVSSKGDTQSSLRGASMTPEGTGKRAQDVMHTGAECVGEHESLRSAAQMMRDLEVGALPICGD